MSHEEFAKIAMILKTAYPRDEIFRDKETLSVWYEMLKDLPYQQTKLAVTKWIATQKWSPAIAEIREAVFDVTIEKRKDWSEAWQDVIYAIRRWGTWDYEKAMQYLDDLTMSVVKRIGGFTMLCEKSGLDADRANFRDVYNTLAKREKEYARIPEAVRKQIEHVTREMIGVNDG